MSRILKRPMFRKGGPAMEGVMKLASGGRAKYQEAGKVTMEDLMKDDDYLKEIYGIAQAGFGRDIQQERSDVLANLLIRGGLAAVSGKGATGNALRDLASAFQGPTDIALKEMAALKQDPARMLVAKTAIEQKGAERLAEIKQKNALLDAQKKAQIIVGPQKSGESDADYAARVNAEAGKIIKESTYGVGSRFETARKDEKLKEYKDDYNLTGDAAELYFGFEKNADKVRKATGQPVRGFMKARPKGAGIQYDGRNKQPGIYYDPYNNNYIEVKGGVATVIPNPLTGVKTMSEIPDVGNKNIVQQQEPNLDDGLSDPMYG
jgi:citrate lyase gamma subunit